MKRRQFIQLIAASSLSTHCAADTALSTPTASQTEGPYYPLSPIPESNNLLLNSEHFGTELRLSGKVLNTEGQVLAGARVEIWQCDGLGIYPHPRAPKYTEFDPNFSGAGATIVDELGQYNFTTIVPVPYTGRPPHIHTKVFLNDAEKLTSQIYLKESGGHKHLKMALVEKSDQIYTSTFNFVINT